MNGVAHTISIRLATADDELALMHLSQLDSAEGLAAPILLAERDGVLQAALSLTDGRSIADPFAPSAELVSLLEVRAAKLAPKLPFASRLRDAIPIRRRARAYAA